MVPERYTQPPAVAPNRTELVIDVDIPTHKFSKLDIVKLPVTRRLENITLHPDLAARLVPAEVTRTVQSRAFSQILICQIVTLHSNLFQCHHLI